MQLYTLLLGEEMVHYAEDHRAVIHRFGRFPPRNAALGRTSMRLGSGRRIPFGLPESCRTMKSLGWSKQPFTVTVLDRLWQMSRARALGRKISNQVQPVSKGRLPKGRTSLIGISITVSHSMEARLKSRNFVWQITLQDVTQDLTCLRRRSATG